MFVAALLATASRATTASAQGVPARLADSTFWRLVTESSEPWGTFRSENFVSNETALQWVIPKLVRRVPPGGVYIGVAPDQNFTLVAAFRPSIAFIVDIRHQNAVEHLMYKALLELSKDRADFLAKLFARAPLTGVDSTATASALFEALARQPADSARYRANLRAIVTRLTDVHRFALSDSEHVSLGCVYGAFFTQGPDLTYGYSSECRNPGPYAYRGYYGGGFRGPTYQAMMTETDSVGVNWSYLGSEKAFRALKDMEERNLIVPLTGDFAGPKALRAVGQWARAHNAKVTTFYVSNVEQYLFEQGDEATRFFENVATLPVDSTSMFVRSFQGGRFYPSDTTVKFTQQSAAGRSMEVFGSIEQTVRAFRAGRIASWADVLSLSRQ
ncbi:MAG: hypothetical protein DMD35_10150 [Gemmatimonadetes bacterium]|nr:MAG: hypothetical protein DMD35_10150 [Gemmatimonadota bacterium]